MVSHCRILTFLDLRTILSVISSFIICVVLWRRSVFTDPLNMFWKMCMNAQEVNQLAFKTFLNTQKIQQSQTLMEQFIQESMSCVADNIAAANKLFQCLSSVKNPEDFNKLQEKVFIEYNDKNIEHVKKLLTLYSNLLQENYLNAKANTDDLTSAFSDGVTELTKKFTDNVTKFAEVNPFANNSCSAKGHNKKHTNSNEEK